MGDGTWRRDGFLLVQAHADLDTLQYDHHSTTPHDESASFSRAIRGSLVCASSRHDELARWPFALHQGPAAFPQPMPCPGAARPDLSEGGIRTLISMHCRCIVDNPPRPCQLIADWPREHWQLIVICPKRIVDNLADETLPIQRNQLRNDLYGQRRRGDDQSNRST